jgi:hypothetical protein
MNHPITDRETMQDGSAWRSPLCASLASVVLALRTRNSGRHHRPNFRAATSELKRGYNSPDPGGKLWLRMLGPLGAGFSKNSAAVDAAYNKLTDPGPGDSLKGVCFRCCSCRPFVASAAITGLMLCVRFRRSSGSSLNRKRRSSSRAMQSPIVASHRHRLAALH